jgi:pimeloyl-ACP methyl ester carboxylesterase
MRRLLRLSITALLCLCAAPTAWSQDHAREARWRTQIVPNLVVGEAVDLSTSDGRTFLGLYTATAAARTALVIVHGIGVHPDHGIIGRIRMDLADRGYSTLSVQMPILANEADASGYPALFPDAVDRITRAGQWLAARGYQDLVLVSHSMGSRMANAYFDARAPAAYRAWVSLGLSGEYSAAFAQRRPVVTLDVYGESDLPAVLAGAAARAATVATHGGGQRRIDGADHFFAGRERELVEAIDAFVRR